MSSFAPEVIEVIGRAFVLMSSAWFVSFLVRRRSAALRAGVWTVAFASLLALPAIARVTPAWKIAVLPAIETTLVTEAPAQAAPVALGAQPERPVFEGRRSGGGGNQSALRESVEPRVESSNNALQSAVRQSAALQIAAPALRTQTSPMPVSPAAIALTLWAGVAFLLLARIAVNRIAAARLIKRSAATSAGDANWRDDVAAAQKELGIARRVGIRFTDAVAVPAVIGVWRPMLLLPLDAGEWTADARRVVILHELAHVARWDAFDQLVTEAGCALYWIVPPVWIAARAAAVLREQATDDAVIRAGVRPSAYAAELIDLAQNIAGVETGAASLAMAGSRIQDRVAAILDPSVHRGRVTVGGALALILAAGLAVTTLAAVSPERQMVVPPVPPAPPAAPAPSAPPAPPAPPAPTATPAPPAPAAEPAQFPPLPPLPPMSLPAPPAPLPPMTPMAPPDAPAPMAALPAMSIAPLPPMPPAPGVPSVPPAQRGTGSTRVSSSSSERSTLCPDGRDSFSNMSNDDGSRKTWSVKISGKGCTVELKSEGKIEFNDDFTDVASITPSGYFRLSVNRSGSRRELDIDGRGAALTRTYRVDGSARTYDAAAKSWFGDFLIELDRETAVGVDARVPKLLKQGGVDAVIKETALMTSDYARSRYYRKLSSLVTLSSAETVRILNQAATLGTQDYYAAELLKSLGAQVGDSATERAALLALVGKMQSDYYIVEGVNSVFTTRQVNASDVDFLMRIMPRVESDYYKQQMVKRIVGSGRVDGAQRGALAQVLTTMREDYYMGAVLADLMRDGGANDAGRQAIIGAVARIKSAYYASEAVRSVLRDARLSEADLVRLVDVVKPMSEDHYKSEALRAIVRHANAGAKVRQAVIDASAGMSKYYRDELLKFVRTP